MQWFSNGDGGEDTPGGMGEMVTLEVQSYRLICDTIKSTASVCETGKNTTLFRLVEFIIQIQNSQMAQSEWRQH